jgi:hypothetical protein
MTGVICDNRVLVLCHMYKLLLMPLRRFIEVNVDAVLYI